jgi:hypothetical protein
MADEAARIANGSSGSRGTVFSSDTSNGSSNASTDSTSTNTGLPDSTTSAGATPWPKLGWGFWLAIAVGLALRAFFASNTTGTLDVDVWKLHTLALEKQGLISYYQGGAMRFNHPPPAAWLISTLDAIASATGISFAAMLRLPFALFDLASVAFILRILAGHRLAAIIAAAFWLHPLAIIYSSYHGNTDSSVAFFLLAATLLVSRNRGLWAGVVLGLSLWIKIPGVVAGPIFLFALADNKQRIHFCLAGAATVLLGFGPALLTNASAVINAVFLYPGLAIHTSSGITTWGLANFFPDIGSLPQSMRLGALDLRDAIARYNSVICIAPMVVLAWLRRDKRRANEIATTIAFAFALFYGLTNFWAFQYFAWTVPFWLLAPRWFGISASLVASVYIYGAYAWMCGDLLLVGTWDFIGKPDWPAWLIAARNAANLFFLVAGLAMLVAAVREAKTAKAS